MVKAILFFVLVWVLVIAGIVVFRAMTAKEKWSVVKTALFGGVTAIVATALVVFIVILF